MIDNLKQRIEMMERHSHAPEIVDRAAEENDLEDLAEICAVVTETVREESIDRGVNKHGGIACLYLVVDYLSERGE